ncbi:MAG: TonB-dependent receptor SusC [Candidatus Ordinivivax streblomastigis]|uniref:TonB-dependent receptor SusC n=1 Tax=Candidatus Ordinivivax streblomastigis TaxID=2540710 RepID=A0A5M8P1C3_9BACT|nr:MAG: TonB-dependent receptor SusC [Candidatus Ordinivivax streblomastigis]
MKKLFSVFMLAFLAHGLSAQDVWRVSGVVTDGEDPFGLPGVSVFVQGSTVGTATDMDGKYTLSIPKGKSLTFSYVGYKTQTIAVKGNEEIDVVMTIDALLLNEVVAIGYGTMKKSDLTGAVASVKAAQLQKTPAAGIDQALQGRVAGVTVNANSGQPGAAAEVRIRGIGTVNDSRPIYVVDGVITDNITFLSPNDIASTEVLKDASATAIYGSRGANGVILVFTIKGSQGKTNISLNSYVGFQNRWHKLDLMQSHELAESILRINPRASTIAIYQQQGFNAWMQRLGSSPYFPMIKSDTNPYALDYASVETDWQDEVFKPNALIHNHYLSMRGGTEKDNYAMSASYFNQDGTIIGSDYERLTLRMNSSHQVRKWLKVGEHLTFVNATGRNAMNNSNSPGASIISAAIAMAPWDPTHYPEGSMNRKGEDLSGQISASSNFENVTNPFSMVQHSHPQNIEERWLGDLFLELTPVKNLVLHSGINLDLANNRNKSFDDAYRYSNFDGRDKNFLSSNMERYRRLTFENTATYTLDVKRHNLSAMLGQTTEEYNYYSIGNSGSSILVPSESNWYLSKTTDDNKNAAGDGVARSRMLSFLGRLHYSFDSRYLFTVNFRSDGSSKFPENPWGFFPSAAVAWRMSDESWLKEVDQLDFLKLRVGWGQIGNDKIDENGFRLTVGSSENVYYGYPLGKTEQILQQGAAILTYVNKGGSWEITEQTDLGIDLGIKKGILSGTVDFFVRDTKDMILSVKGPAHVGNRFDPVKNVGTVRNSGIEISLDHQQKINQLNYHISGNVSFVKNELTELNGGSPVISQYQRSDKGLGLFTFWGYQYEGVYRSDDEALEHLFYYKDRPNEMGFHAGDAKFSDLSGPNGVPDGKIDDDDKTDLGSPFPWLTYGLNLGADYRGFDVQVFFQGVYGNKIYNAMRYRTEGSGNEATLSTTMRNVYVDFTPLERNTMEGYGVDWTKLINTEGSIPKPLGNPLNNTAASERFVESGAYLRLKNVQFGYTIPKKITQKWAIERCRLYVTGSNLLAITPYTGYDPEIGGGVDYGNYPQSRTFMLGVNLDF